MSDALYELLTRGNELWDAPASVSSFMAKLGVPGDRLGDYIRGDSANLPFVSGCDQFTNLFTKTVPKIRSLFMERRNDRHFVPRVRISLSLSRLASKVLSERVWSKRCFLPNETPSIFVEVVKG